MNEPIDEFIKSAPSPAPTSDDHSPPKLKETRGRRKKSAAEKSSAKTKRDADRKNYIQSLVDSGKLSTIEANRLAGDAKVKLDDKYSVNTFTPSHDYNDVEGTVYDPELDSNKYDVTIISKNELRGKKRPGLIPTFLSDNEKSQILTYLRTGIGSSASLLTLSISYSRYRRTLLEDPDFAAEVRLTEDSLIGLCEGRIYEAAMMGDVGSASRYINIRASQKASQFERILRSKEFKLRQQAVEAQLNVINQNQRPSFACLSDAELEDYENITNKIKSNQPPDADELTRLGIYSAKLIQANTPKPAITDFVQQEASAIVSPQTINATFKEEPGDE